jgi:hypothetical protein
MSLLETQISNSYRVWYLGITFVTIYISVLLAVIFFSHAIRYKGKMIQRTNFAMAIMSFLLGINFVLNIIYPYFSNNEVNLTHIFYDSVAVSAVLSIYIVEPLYRSNRLFSILNGICAFFFFIIPIDSDLIVIPMILSLSFIIGAGLFFKFLWQKTGGKTQKHIKLFICFFILTYLGSGMNVHWLVDKINHDWFTILAYIVVLVGCMGMFFSLNSVEVFIEASWKEHLQGVYIISKLTNSLIYSKIFATDKNQIKEEQQNSQANPDSSHDLLSSGLIGINSIMQEITESKEQGISSIEKDGKFVLIEHLDKELVCFFTTKQMESTRYFLKKIRDAWKTYYSDESTDWTAISPDALLPMNKIIDQILSNEDIGGKF